MELMVRSAATGIYPQQFQEAGGVERRRGGSW